MSRTPEQKAADEALTAAIEAAARLHFEEGQGWVMSEYVTVAAHHRFDEEGESYTAVSLIYRDGDVPYHRALGLLEYAAARMRAAIMED